LLQQGRLRVQNLPPPARIYIARIVHSFGVLAVPVHAKINAHVIADKNNAASTKLQSKIECVKTAIPAPPYLSETIKQQAIAITDQSY
jgi:hypothetical protein